MKITNSVSKPLVALAALVAIGAGAGLTAIASAATDTTTTTTAQTQGHRGPGVMGTIASISGTTLTITGKDGTTYTADISSAKVMVGKEGAAPTAGSASDLKVGDIALVRGTVSGTSVAATEVMSGDFHGGMGHGRGPGVRGTVSSINGNTLTITNTDGTSYTVDASSAKVQKTVDLTVSDIQVGDTVGVMGTVSGTSVTAEHITDGILNAQGPPATAK